MRDPSGLPLDVYEVKLGDYLRSLGHRDTGAGWQRDKGVRDTEPFTATLVDGTWQGQYHGTHAPVMIWYSPEMLDWLHANRPVQGDAPAEPAPVPKGAMMVKEMYPVPAAACTGVEDVTTLLPASGAAVMVREPGGLEGRLVLGLVRLERLGPGLARRAVQPPALPGLRPILRELPRLGGGQPHLRGPEER